MILKLSIRNALRHGKTSLLILFFMTAVGMVFMGGSSLFVSVNRAMRDGFRCHLTADAVIMAETRDSMSLFGATVPAIGEFFSLPPLEHKADAVELLGRTGLVKGAAPLISGSALMEADGYGRGVPFFGVQADSYRALFPDMEMRGGAFLDGSQGVMVSQALADEWERERGRPLNVGDQVKFTTAGDIGFTIRLLPVKGIYRHPWENPLIDPLVLMDDGSARDLVRVLADQTSASSPEEASDLLDSLDLDALLSGGDGPGASESEGSDDILASLDALLAEPVEEEPSEGSWHFLLVRFADRARYGAALRELEDSLEDLPLQVLNWRQAAGTAAGYAFFIQLFFYGGFILILLAGILGIVNVMLISLFQRTVEIGTIQALGGTSSFVRRLLLGEFMIVSLAGAVLSLVLSALLFRVLNARGILMGNSLLNMVFGGKPLYFPFAPLEAAATLAVCLLTGWASSLYPVKKALELEPVEALKGGDHES